MVEGSTFSQKSTVYLLERWEQVSLIEENNLDEPLSDKLYDLKVLIKDCLTSKTKTYRYVLPTQILSKCVDSSLDCRSIQVAWGVKGAFDARSIAHDVIVPFDRSNHSVLVAHQSHMSIIHYDVLRLPLNIEVNKKIRRIGTSSLKY